MRNCTFTNFRRVTRHWNSQRRLEFFLSLHPDLQEAMWASLGRDMRAQRIYEHERERHEVEARGFLGEARPELRAIRHSLEPKPEPPPFLPGLSRSIEKRQALDEYLLTIPASDYIEKLSGQPADDRRGKAMFCPLPDHNDTNTPNFYAYEFNWRCYACGAQGRIYQFAALMWGYQLPLRGSSFNEVFDRLCSVYRLD